MESIVTFLRSFVGDHLPALEHVREPASIGPLGELRPCLRALAGVQRHRVPVLAVDYLLLVVFNL